MKKPTTVELYSRYVLARKYAWRALEHGYESDEYQAAVKKQEQCWRDYYKAQRARSKQLGSY